MIRRLAICAVWFAISYLVTRTALRLYRARPAKRLPCAFAQHDAATSEPWSDN